MSSSYHSDMKMTWKAVTQPFEQYRDKSDSHTTVKETQSNMCDPNLIGEGFCKHFLTLGRRPGNKNVLCNAWPLFFSTK